MMARTGARSGTVTAATGLRSSQMIKRKKKEKQALRDVRGPHVMRWLFTDNGEAGKRGTTLTAEAWKKLPKGVRFITWQMERGAETGQLHLQGYLELETAQYVTYLHSKVSATAGFIVARATGEKNAAYCHKDETRVAGPWSLGEMTKGQPGGFKAFVDAVAGGARLRTLIYTHPAMVARYKAFYWTIREQMMPKRAEGETVQIILALGKTRSGKSRHGYEKWRTHSGGYWKMPVNNGTVWFDGYDDHAIAQWDESSGKFSSMKLTALLEYLDRYPILVPVKGGHTWWMPKIIYLTTNIHPAKWYDYVGRECQRDALKARFTMVLDFDDKDEGGKPSLIDLENWDWEEPLGFELFQEPFSYGVRPRGWGERSKYRTTTH